MNKPGMNYASTDQCGLSSVRARFMLLVLWGVLVTVELGASGQENLHSIISVPTQVVAGKDIPGKGEAKRVKTQPNPLLSQLLGGPVTEVLLRSGFVAREHGILRRDKITVGDLRKLLKYEDRNLKLAPGSDTSAPAYLMWFADALCVLNVAERDESIHDDATVVNVLVNPNPPVTQKRP